MFVLCARQTILPEGMVQRWKPLIMGRVSVPQVSFDNPRLDSESPILCPPRPNPFSTQ